LDCTFLACWSVAVTGPLRESHSLVHALAPSSNLLLITFREPSPS
jgi:hypothetical protein